MQAIDHSPQYKVPADPILPMTETAAQPSRTRWIVALLALAGLIVATRALPVERWIEELRGWIDGFGALGMLMFGAVYVIAAVLFVPGSALTLAAGAMFGLWWGTALVSVASTTAAAIAFLIARNFARSAVERRVSSNPRFAAIDRAIGKGGWKIVGLLRLSPAVPFSLSNYMYGLTAVRFVPYVLASWVAMLPATFMFVYIGHAGAQGLAAASGDDPVAGGRTALMVVGLAATIAVTVYVTRLAKRAIAEETELADAGTEETAR